MCLGLSDLVFFYVQFNKCSTQIYCYTAQNTMFDKFFISYLYVSKKIKAVVIWKLKDI